MGVLQGVNDTVAVAIKWHKAYAGQNHPKWYSENFEVGGL